jgi:hypothetical protein
VVFSQPSPGKRAGFTVGQASITPSQVSDQLQRSGVDLDKLQQISQDSPFSLSQSSSPVDGSYIRPFGADTGHDVAGWEIYDGQSKIGNLILGVNDRLGVLIEATNIFPGALAEIVDKIDFGQITRALGSDEAR